MIELFEHDLKTDYRRSSKGNQLKWKNGKVWYKADYLGYEGLAEYVVSKLLESSSLHAGEYVSYHLEEFRYKDQVFKGVRSDDFLEGGWQIITLERLFKAFTGNSLTGMFYRMTDEEDRLQFIVEQTQRITGLKAFGQYMNKILTIDALFLNEDRHLHNVAVLMGQEDEYRYCPIFDHGAGLLSDTTMEYPIGKDLEQLMKNVKPKTFSDDFDRQLDLSECLYGEHLHFFYCQRDIDEILAAIHIYEPEIKERVRQILYDRVRKYAYLFG